MIEASVRPSTRVGQSPAAAMPPLQRTQVLEAQQQGRENAVLLASLPGAARPAFQLPDVLPLSGAGSFPAPRSGPGAYSPTGARERLNVALLETLQARRQTSALISAAASPAGPPYSRPAFSPFQPLRPASAPRIASAGSSLAELAAGEEITTALAAAPSNATSRRVANEAYQMELDAQQQLQQQLLQRQAAGASNRWEWFA